MTSFFQYLRFFQLLLCPSIFNLGMLMRANDIAILIIKNIWIYRILSNLSFSHNVYKSHLHVCLRIRCGKHLYPWVNCQTMCAVSYHSSQLTYPCVSWLSHTSTPHNTLSKQLAAFPHKQLANWLKTKDACHGEFCQMLRVWTHNLWIYSLFCYWLSYPGLAANLQNPNF